MRTFVDTSALYALLDEDDGDHTAAAEWFSGPGRDPTLVLVTHNYVVVETAALVQRRLGHDAARVLLDALLPATSVFFVDEVLHHRAAAAYLAGSPGVSLVDRVSFELMRGQRIEEAFAFDGDFPKEGFTTVP